MTSKEEKLLKDREYNFCTRCNAKEVTQGVTTIDIDDGGMRTEELCSDCLKESFPIRLKCEGCGEEDGASKRTVIDIETGEKVTIVSCDACLEDAINMGVYEELGK